MPRRSNETGGRNRPPASLTLSDFESGPEDQSSFAASASLDSAWRRQRSCHFARATIVSMSRFLIFLPSAPICPTCIRVKVRARATVLGFFGEPPAEGGAGAAGGVPAPASFGVGSEGEGWPGSAGVLLEAFAPLPSPSPPSTGAVGVFVELLGIDVFV